jgi:hypothetical protein
MQNKMKLIIAILIITLTACGQSTKSLSNKKEIDLKTIDHIDIRQKLYDQNAIRLTKQQTKDLVTKWNNSKSEGPCKYFPKLWLTVTLKDGTTRTFRANGENIKEDNDWCYSIGDNDYFNLLWTENKKNKKHEGTTKPKLH